MKAKGDDIVICEPLRPPIGRYGGSLKELSAAELGAQLLDALVQRAERSAVDVLHALPPSITMNSLPRVAALEMEI